jgi:bifunctional aspartokinase / homoserine dehydrogenase 1
MPNPRTLVMKFGGTSVGTAQAMSEATQIVSAARAEWPRVVVVTSAISGVTDLLLESATRAAAGDVSQLPEAEKKLRKSHGVIASSLIADPDKRKTVMAEIEERIYFFVDLCRAISLIGEASPRTLDAVASLGERMSVRLLAAVIEEIGPRAKALDASTLIVTNAHFQNAHPDLEATTRQTRSIVLPLLEDGIVPVVTGFIGATPEGVVTTLGRGGSDYSAAVLGAVLPANDVWIWTDVNGVMTADPRIVPDARTLPEVTYSEVSELAYFGAKVLHPKTVRPVVEAGIGLRICNTFNPSHPGTRLVSNTRGNGTSGNGYIIKAVTAIRRQRLITIEGRGMLGIPGVAARAFGAVASTGTSVPLISQASSEQSICFAVPAEACDSVLFSLERTFAEELEENDIDRVWATADISIITVVGAKMRSSPGVAGKVFGSLGDKNVNVLAIAQGSSEVSISMVVESDRTEDAVKALHDLIIK